MSFLLCLNDGKTVNMLVYVISHLSCPTFLVHYKVVVIIVKLGHLFKQRHKLVVGAVGLNLVFILFI